MKNKRLYYTKFWLAVFLYILTIGLLFQFLILPFAFPVLHAGDGLLNVGDWNYFQHLAFNLLEEIKLAGWSAWQLRPEGQAPAGIAAAIYMLTGVAKPWTILPLNAAAHATSALILLSFVDLVSGRRTSSLLPVLPFSFFPTALLWNTQFHKDGIFILGAFLFLYGLLILVNTNSLNNHAYSISGAASIIIGIFLIWIVRPYGVEIVIYIGLVLAVIASVNILFKKGNEPRYFYRVIYIWLALLVSFTYSTSEIYEQYIEVDYIEINMNDQDQNVNESSLEFAESNDDNLEASLNSANDKSSNSELAVEGSAAWRKSKFLPSLIDEKFYQIAIMRERYLEHKPDTSSNIDLAVRFSSAGDTIRYVPRALVIGLLAPFPTFWFNWGSVNLSALMRLSGGLEMLLSYLAIIGLLAGFWIWHKRVELYLAVGFAVGMILSYSIVVANVGTLHRMRYGFMMVLVAIGIAAIQEIITKRQLMRNENNLTKGQDGN